MPHDAGISPTTDNTPSAPVPNNRFGVYEKALTEHHSWSATFNAAAEAGYDFYELSIDESRRRLARLHWTPSQRRCVRSAAHDAGVEVFTIALSAHRAAPLGSASSTIRRRSRALASKAIDLAVDLGATCVQLPGYFTYYEPTHPDARKRYIEGLHQAALQAAAHNIVLAVENVDGTDILSAADGLDLLRDTASPALSLYVDVGNYAANKLDVLHEVQTALPAAFAIQLKDARPGVFRRVPFGAGDVPFPALIKTLDTVGYARTLSIEMWNDDADASLAADALTWIRKQTTHSRRPAR